MSEHFSLTELTASSTAVRLGIDNTPNGEIANNLSLLADQLETVRAMLGNKPMHIDSGYRCPELNAAVGGAKDSAHLSGFAADFTCPDFGSPESIVTALEAAGLKYDQLIQEGTWVHVSFAPAMRQQTLTAHFVAGAKATYTFGA
jgi:hypothetical protein